MLREKIEVVLSKLLTPIAYLFPIHTNRIIFKSFDLKYTCNPKYLCEYLNNKHNGEFELIYVTANSNNESLLNEKGIKTCKIKSLKYHYFLFTSKFIIVNHAYPQYLPKKKNQIAIFTDHGIDLFKYLKNQPHENKNFEIRQYKKIDKFLFSSELDASNGKKKFCCDEGRMLYSGLPRISLFFDKDFKCEIDYKEILNIPKNKKTILYAPTFRKDHDKKFLEKDFKKIISACEKRFGGEFVLLNRDHNFTLKDDGKKYNADKIYECNTIEDVQILLYSCDVIITDYSSLMWDAAFSKHPCFLYIYDIDDYLKTWGFHTDFNKLPYPCAKTIDDFCNKILNFDNEKYKQDLQSFFDYVKLRENGTACEQIYNYMRSTLK